MAGKGLILPRGGTHVVFLELRRQLARSFPVTGPQPLSSLRRAGNWASRPGHRALALGKIEGRRRRGRQRWLDGITNSVIPSVQEVTGLRMLQLKRGVDAASFVVTALLPALCVSAPQTDFSSYLSQPGPACGSPHPGRSLFRELSLSYSGQLDLGRSLLE